MSQASELMQLIQQLQQISEETKRIAQSLQQYKQKFTEQSQKVQAQIGGSDTERRVVETLNAAGGSIDQTVVTLTQAAQACEDISARLPQF
uniref:hypothetical protein n=1 Tax=Bifidobacterium adolescentis TaxID=1680 RepID=UPI00359CAF23